MVKASLGCFVMFALTAMADLRTLKEYWNMKQVFWNIYQSLVSLFAVNLQPKQKQMYKMNLMSSNIDV